jgi:hypothetical protein
MKPKIELPESKFVEIVKVRFSVRCSRVGHTWGVSLLGDGSLPIGWDHCVACQQDKNKDGRNYFEGGDDEQATYR